MLLAGVVILYHPDDDAIQNIHTYLPYIQKLYLVDNTENTMSNAATQLGTNEKITLRYDGTNQGIAKRLNEAAEWAIDNGFEWLLTMDQDSRFEEADLQNYLLCIHQFQGKEKVAMFGVEHENDRKNAQHCAPLETNKLITSGSAINLQLFATVGNFNERLFIDEVDFEYCYRARLQHYFIIQFQNVFLHHRLGVLSQHLSLKDLKKTNRALHSPKRMYYMVRNFFYVNRQFKKHFPEDIKKSRQGLMNRIKNNLLYNKKRKSILLNIYKGFTHYLLNKY